MMPIPPGWWQSQDRCQRETLEFLAGRPLPESPTVWPSYAQVDNPNLLVEPEIGYADFASTGDVWKEPCASRHPNSALGRVRPLDV